MSKLVEQARFSDTGLTHYRNYLTVSGACFLQSLPEQLNFFIPADKPGESARGCGL